MGTPHYAVRAAPAVEVVQELMPEEGMGPVRETGYAHLPLGTYDTRQAITVRRREVQRNAEGVPAGIKHFNKTDADFNNAYGILEISQNQPHLKMIQWEIHWLSAQGEEESLHRRLLPARKFHVLGTIWPA